MIRRCDDRDFELIWDIVNDGARAYRGLSLEIAGQNHTCPGTSFIMKSTMVLPSGDTRRAEHWKA